MSDYYSDMIYKAKEYALRGWDFNNDMYDAVLKVCNTYSSNSELGRLARNILYTVVYENKGYKLKYVSRRPSEEATFVRDGYSLMR